MWMSETVATDNPQLREQAEHALEVAKFPLVRELSEKVGVTYPDSGSYHFFSAADFAPAYHDLSNLSYEAEKLRSKWRAPQHVTMFNRRLDNLGSRVGDIIFYESIFTAGHKLARAAFSAIVVEDEGISLALWDDGEPYDPDEAEGLFTKEFSQPIAGHPSEVAMPVMVAETVAMTFRGMLSVLSGNSRTDITMSRDSEEYIAKTTEEARIQGNLVIAYLPNQPSTL